MKIPEGWKLVPVEPNENMLGYIFSASINQARKNYRALLAAAPTPPAQSNVWTHECEELCKSAEGMQRAVNELWKAQNPEELQDCDTAMSEDDAVALHNECWRSLQSSAYRMRKRMGAPPTTTPPAQEAEPVSLIIRDVCELEPDDPEDSQTVSVNVTTLHQIIERHTSGYTRPQSDELRKAAEEVVAYADSNSMNRSEVAEQIDKLRTALEKKS